jgi:hypothetical protein
MRRGSGGRPPRNPKRTSVRWQVGRRLTRAEDLGPPGYRAGGRRPAPDLAGVAPVRLTAYLTPHQVLRLRDEVRRRQSIGQRADLSMLLREAVDLYLHRPASRRKR